jgi:hypothetical protein
MKKGLYEVKNREQLREFAEFSENFEAGVVSQLISAEAWLCGEP